MFWFLLQGLTLDHTVPGGGGCCDHLPLHEPCRKGPLLSPFMPPPHPSIPAVTENTKLPFYSVIGLQMCFPEMWFGSSQLYWHPKGTHSIVKCVSLSFCYDPFYHRPQITVIQASQDKTVSRNLDRHQDTLPCETNLSLKQVNLLREKYI